jgi:hypothetical protein
VINDRDFEKFVPLWAQHVPLVYCLRSGGDRTKYKIGKSSSLVSRLKRLQDGNPEQLHLEGFRVHKTLKGGTAHETEIKQVYDKSHIHGDWYAVTRPFLTEGEECRHRAFCGYCKGLINAISRVKKLRRRRQFMRRITEASWADQLVLRENRPNRRKANRQHQWVRRKRVVTYRGNSAPWDEDNEVNPKIDLKMFLKK